MMPMHWLPKTLGLSLLLTLAGCNNYPHPQEGTNADGSPRLVWYQALEEDPRSMDPQVQYDDTSAQILGNINETLYEYNYLKRQRMELQPGLAAALPIRTPLADGGEIYTIQIKKGIRYQDDPCFTGGRGREVVSDDFIYALKRIGDPFLQAPTSSPVFDPLSQVIVGLKEFYERAKKSGKTDYNQPISGIQRVDRYTFTIRLKTLYPQLRYWMATPSFFAPVPTEAVAYYDGEVHDGVRRERFMFHPVGTGAYKLKEWKRNQSIVLVRNENHRHSFFPTTGDPGSAEKGLLVDAGKPLPFIDEARFNIMREAIPSWTLFRQGYLDSLGKTAARRQSQNIVEQGITADNQLTGDFAKSGTKLEQVALFSADTISFNMKDPLLGKNKKLRQALALAYNFDRFNDFFYNGTKIKTESPLPPGLFGYDPDYKNPYGRQDVVKAKILLKEAGYPDGIDPKTGKPLSVEVVYPFRGPESQREAEYITEQFRAIGINARANLVTFAESLNKQDRGNFQIIRNGWFADYPDPENFMFLYYSKNPGVVNTSRYENLEFDRLFLQMQSMEDVPERRVILRKMVDILNEDCPVIHTYHEAFYMPYGVWTQNVLQHPVAYNLMKYYKVDPVLREQKQREWNQPNYLFVLVLAGLASVAFIPAVLLRKDR